MKTTNIFKTLAFAMLMPTMLFTTACTNEDDPITEQANPNGYAIPVTITVNQQGDEGSTRSTYTTSTNTLSIGEGDKLFVQGTATAAGNFAGTLDYTTASGTNCTFTGTIYTTQEYTGTAEDLMTTASSVTATLLPKGYESYGYLSVTGTGADATLTKTDAKAIVPGDKALGVEQLSYLTTSSYSSGFTLVPQNAIIALVIADLTTVYSSNLTVSLKDGDTEKASYTDVSPYNVLSMVVPTGSYSGLTVDFTDGTTAKSVSLFTSSKTLEANHVYNAVRQFNENVVNLNTATYPLELTDGAIVTGNTTANALQISIKDGATVTLSGASMTYLKGGLTCSGDATIILNGSNTVGCNSNQAAGVFIPSGKTLTIEGPGSLTATGYNGPGIGAGSAAGGNIIINGGTITAKANVYNCNGTAGIGGSNAKSINSITINGGNITATGSNGGAGIGGGYCQNTTCGKITITGGTVNATGGSGEYAGPGIGCGCYIDPSNTCGDIEISGGTVTATGGTQSGDWGGGSGIGTGFNKGGGDTKCGTITISGGNITAIGAKWAAGIGTGTSLTNGLANYDHYNKCGLITIDGGTVSATGGAGAPGIGTGSIAWMGVNECAGVTITSNATKIITTKGADAKYPIGIGTQQSGSTATMTIGDITIDGTTSWTAGTATTNFNWTVTTTTNTDDTWTLTHK